MPYTTHGMKNINKYNSLKLNFKIHKKQLEKFQISNMQVRLYLRSCKII